MTIDTSRLRVNRYREIVLRYAVWKKRNEVVVSVYGFTGITSVRQVLLQRVGMDDFHSDAYYDEAGRNLAALWATTNCLGDFQVYRGTNLPSTYRPKETENQP